MFHVKHLRISFIKIIKTPMLGIGVFDYEIPAATGITVVVNQIFSTN